MKQAIFAKLVLKYPGLPKAFLGTLAEKSAPKVTEESKIDEYLTSLETLPISVEDMAAEFQKEGDRRATEAVEAHKKKNPTPPDPNNPTPPTPPADPKAPAPPVSETPLEKMVREMKAELDGMKSEKTIGGLREQLNAKLTEKKISAILAKHIVLTPETDLDAIVTGLEADQKELMQNSVTTNLKTNNFKPGGAGGAGGDSDPKEATKEESKAVLDKII